MSISTYKQPRVRTDRKDCDEDDEPEPSSQYNSTSSPCGNTPACPVEPCSEELNRRIAADMGAGFRQGLVRCGDCGFLLQGHVTVDQLRGYRSREVRPGDVWVVSLPKSGTTWTEEMVWLLENDLDYEAAKTPLSPDRWEFFERAAVFDPHHVTEIINKAQTHVTGDVRLDPADIFAPTSAHRKFVQSHLPLSLSPPALLDKARVVYVARNPKDVVVSYYHHMKLLLFQGCDADFATFFRYFIRGEMIETPFFPHVLEAWNHRHHPNMCFIFYEDMKRDLPAVLRRVARFLGKSYTENQLAGLAEHLSFENFRRNPHVNKEWMRSVPGFMSAGGAFVRRGRTGDWQNHLTPQMAAQMDVWIAENTRGTGLKFVDRLSD